MFNENNPWGPFSNLTPVVKNLLIINVLMFIATLVAESRGIFLVGELGLFYFDSPLFKFYQIFTYMFMHGSIGHIFFNMLALTMFGAVLEQRWGVKRFLFFYIVTGLGSGILYTMVHAIQLQFYIGSITSDLSTAGLNYTQIQALTSIYFIPCVGASGAIFGLLTAFAFMFPDAEMGFFFLPVRIKAKHMVIGYAVIELALGIKPTPMDNVAHFAHLGGLATALIILSIWKKQGKLWGKW